jgi:translation initiation factor 1A
MDERERVHRDREQHDTSYEDEEGVEQRIPLPRRNGGEMMAVVEQHMGGGRLRAVCEDEKVRMARIPGKIRKRRWIKTGGLIIIKPWDFQSDKADVVYRYTPTQVSNLLRKGLVPENLRVLL